MSFQERRGSERKPYINSVEIYAQESKKLVGKGYIMNWCENGFGIVTSHQLQAGKKIVMFCDIPNGLEFDFIGEVAYVEERLDSKAYGIKLLPGQAPCIYKFSQHIMAA